MVLIVNVIRTLKYYDYSIVTKGSLLLSFGLLNTKAPSSNQKKFRLRLLKGIIFKENGILELKIKQALAVKRRKQVRNRNSGM
jgi:hypothetical protein